jgi:hypothetical protein
MAIGDWLGDIFGSGEAEQLGAQATAQSRTGLKYAKAAREEGRKDVRTGIEKGTPYFQQAVDTFSPLGAQKQGVYDLYLDSLGVNGPEGNTRALGAYQHSPGFDFALSQALEAAQRNGAAAGNLNSGNTLMALSDRAQQLQNLDYGNWQDRLMGQDPSSVYGQKAGALTNLGGFLGNQYNNLANVGLQGGQLVQGANNGVGAALGNQAQIAGTNAAQGWSGLLGIGSGIGSFFGA